jgi:hypothetical protein
VRLWKKELLEMKLLYKYYICLILLFSPGFFADAATGHYKKFVVIVPVYRELYSQNIGSLLLSLYNQKLEGLPFQGIDVWFVVNNTIDANPGVRIENQETVAFLEALANKQNPTVRPEHLILQEIANKPVFERLHIHVMDLTTPGRPARNIGEIRDIGVKKVIAELGPTRLDSTLIAQMDADTAFGPNYVRTVVNSFENADLKFALMTMYYDDQPDSEPRVYQRKITADYRGAAHEFRHAYDKSFPQGGGPRIVVTAKAMAEVGGVPHELVGEDTALIAKLKERFPGQGRFLDNSVFAKYRARDDGYDAAIYQKSLGDPIEFGPFELETSKLLDEVFVDFLLDPLQKSLYDEAVSQLEREYRVSVIRLRSLVHIMIHDLHDGTRTLTPASDFPALVNNPWFTDWLKTKIAEYGANEDKILSDLVQEFPYHFSNPPTDVTVKIIQLRAATEVLLQRPFLHDLTHGKINFSYLSVLREKFPLSSKLLELQLQGLIKRGNPAKALASPKPMLCRFAHHM